MATYLMFGEYSRKAIKGITAERTGEAIALIEKHGGVLKCGYALLGDADLVLIVDLPDNEQALKTSVALTKELGIAFTTTPAVTIEEFDRLMADV